MNGREPSVRSLNLISKHNYRTSPQFNMCLTLAKLMSHPSFTPRSKKSTGRRGALRASDNPMHVLNASIQTSYHTCGCFFNICKLFICMRIHKYAYQQPQTCICICQRRLCRQQSYYLQPAYALCNFQYFYEFLNNYQVNITNYFNF